MADVGRNAPCPCGSGRKYKHCHLGKDEARPRRHALGEASERLTLTILRSMPKREVAEAVEVFTRPPDAFAALGLESAEAEPSLFVPWAAYVWPGESGQPAATRYLARHRSTLPAAEVALLEAEARTPVSLWEVVEPRPGEGFLGRDLLTHRESFVRDVSASTSVVARAVLLARVVDVAGEGMLSGSHPALLSPAQADQVVSMTLGLLHRRKLPLKAEEIAAPVLGLTMLHAWRLASAPRPPPTLTNTEGDPLELTTERFRFAARDREEILSLLSAEERVQREDEGEETAFVFTVAGNPKIKEWDNTIVGRVVVGRDALAVETNSARRAAALRERVERSLGPRLRFAGRETIDSAELAARRGHRTAPAPKEVPPPELLEALRGMKEAHYRSWLDQALPALDGKTPRQAARTPAGRRKLEVLLRELEFGEAKVPLHERFDVTTLRAQLGLS